ncbi:FecR family protein [Sphingobacterium chuzhouense]|uniref:FecR domain-containing protein n=1 Tax=Sphingobacterium chuzhouense TaxID=1742264 RepID=A0ABR7XLW1_9SPHI|nr:FecR domain-containing protein [Sphingobacterium chuzhouense]MBD1420160.1 FecR domain-containing protein [Sphingobacterium chuzhouense]
MERKVEDILSGESPREDLDKEVANDTRKWGEHILKILKLAKPHKLSSDAYTALWTRIEETTKKASQRDRQIRIFKYSAVACALIALSFLFWNIQDRNAPYDSLLYSAMNNQNLITEEEEVSIRRGDGRQTLISDGEVIDLSLNGRNENWQKKASTFNTLTVPYGKRIEVILPDNSKVWLNAGSQLTFPTVFDADERQVYLEGEGYFDVEGDPKRPFYVHTANMVVKVLGTTFNISSYKDDAFASTVLLSGEIELQGTGETSFEPQILKPGTAAILRKDSKSLSISTEAVEDHISWRQKQLILKNTPLAEIIARLERVYNTDITVESASGANETFSGRLDLTQPLTNLLTTLYNPLEYQLQKEERRIIINKR